MKETDPKDIGDNIESELQKSDLMMESIQRDIEMMKNSYKDRVVFLNKEQNNVEVIERNIEEVNLIIEALPDLSAGAKKSNNLDNSYDIPEPEWQDDITQNYNMMSFYIIDLEKYIDLRDQQVPSLNTPKCIVMQQEITKALDIIKKIEPKIMKSIKSLEEGITE